MKREPRLRKFEFDADKFKELIVYIAENSADDPAFGAVKLNKILYYSDFDAYRLLGEPITGATYRKLQAGPAPKELLAARDELIEENRVRTESRPYFNRIQKRLVVLDGGASNIEMFSPGEREIIDSVIEFLGPMSAREASDYSHREPGWLLAGEREEIPYESAGLSAEAWDQETEEYALSVALRFLEERRQQA